MASRIFILSIICLLLATSSGRADGESRPATRAETDFIRIVYDVLQKAAPRGPVGWEETERSDGAVPDQVPRDVETSPMRLEYHIKWVDAAKSKSMQKKKDELASNFATAPIEPDPALQKRYEELAAMIGTAAAKGDIQAAESLQKEMDAVGTRISNPAAEAEIRFKKAVRAAAARDLYIKLSLSVNESQLSFQEGLKGPSKHAPLSGNVVYRLNDESFSENHAEWVEGTTCVVLGPWNPVTKAGQKGLAANHLKRLPHTKVQSVSVCAQATSVRARAVLEMVQWSMLKTLLGN